MSTDKVQAYYDAFDEWSRLGTPAGILEYERTLRILHAHLKPHSRILDLGGGPGRYTIALAQAGHRLCLADLSPRLLQIARQKIADHGVTQQVESITCTSATNLKDFTSNSFDAVLALGPFYHLTDPADRESAAREITRILQPDGLLVVAFVPRLSALAGLIDRAAASPDQVPPEVLHSVAQTGIFHNPTPQGFQEGFYPEPDELARLLARHGVRPIATISTRSFAYGHETALQQIRQQNPDLHDHFLNVIAATEQDPAAISLGGHALYLARKGAT